MAAQEFALGPEFEEKLTTNKAEISTTESGELSEVNEFHILNPLGAGSFATVYCCVRRGDLTGKKYAVKVFERNRLNSMRSFGGGRAMQVSSEMDKVYQEVAIMKKLDHPNLVQLHEVIDDAESNQLFLVMEYAEHGTVLSFDEDQGRYVARNGDAGGLFSEDRAAEIVASTLSALEYLHQNHIAHRDIKPDNILMGSNGRVLLADFGVAHYFKEEEGKEKRSAKELSRSMSRGQITRTEGTYAFWAPEMCQGEGAFSAYAVDLWAVGVCTFCMIFGKPPFTGGDALALFESIQKEPLVMPGPLSDPGDAFLRGLLQKTPQDRLTLADAIVHPWLAGSRASRRPHVTQVVPPSDEEVANAFFPVKDFLVHSPSGRFPMPMRRHTNDADNRAEFKYESPVGKQSDPRKRCEVS